MPEYRQIPWVAVVPGTVLGLVGGDVAFVEAVDFEGDLVVVHVIDSAGQRHQLPGQSPSDPVAVIEPTPDEALQLLRVYFPHLTID